MGATDTPQALTALSEGLVTAARGCGIPVDARAFRSHITVYRKARRPRCEPAPFNITWPITDYCLIGSVTAPERAQYRVLQRWPLS